MSSIFPILYLILLLVYIISAAIIIYHIARFSYKKSVMTATIGIFLVVFGLLLLANITSFLAIDWRSIFSFVGN